MLSVPWFVVRTVQELFRLTPIPVAPQQQQSPTEQHQPLQQQQKQQPLIQQKHRTLQQPQSLEKQQVLHKQSILPQQQQSPSLEKQQVLHQQSKQPQQQQPQALEQQQVLHQQSKQPQQQQPQALEQQQVLQQQSKQPQQQQKQRPKQQQQIPILQQKKPPQIQSEAPKPTAVRVQNTSSQAGNSSPAETQDIIQSQTAAPLQRSAVPSTHQAETNSSQHIAEAFPQASPSSVAETTLSPALSSSVAETTLSPASPSSVAETTLPPALPSPVAETVLSTSSKTLVLAPSVSAGRMSFEWAQQQVEKFKFDFDQADKDKSGALSFEEVYDVLLRVGFKGTKEEAKFIFGHLDRDHDQKINREEFTAALKSLPRLSIKEFVLRKTFLQLDKDGSGYLSRSEIEDATKSEGGLNIAADKIADLLIYLCKEDQDGKVSYEEFLRVLGVESAATVMRQVFAKLDSDGSGFLSKEEILEAVKAESELKLKAEKISDLLCYWCRDQDKKISYEEFVDVWLQQKGEKPGK